MGKDWKEILNIFVRKHKDSVLQITHTSTNSAIPSKTWLTGTAVRTITVGTISVLITRTLINRALIDI